MQNNVLELIIRNKSRYLLSVDQDANSVHQGEDQPIYNRISSY